MKNRVVKRLVLSAAAALLLSAVPAMAQDPEDLELLEAVDADAEESELSDEEYDPEMDEAFDLEDLEEEPELSSEEEDLLLQESDFNDDLSSIPEDLDTTEYLLKDADQYVSWTSMEGLEVTRQVYAVTDEDVQERVQQELSAYSTEEDADRPAREEDFIYATVTYTVQGTGETETLDDMVFYIGDEYYGPEFDEALIGCAIGDEISVSVSYDENDTDSEWPGQTVDFEVTVSGVTHVIAPEYTDEFVKENFGYESTAEFEQSLRETMQLENDENADSELYNNVLAAAVEQCEFGTFPEELLEESKQELVDTYSFYFGQDAITYEEVASLFGMSTEELDAAVADDMKYTVFISAYALTNGIRIPRSTYTEYLIQEATFSGYPDVATYEEDYGRQALIRSLYEQKVSEALLETANITDVTTSSQTYDNLMFEDEGEFDE